MGIYKLMEKDWKAYCIMSAIAYIEEMSKPTEHIQIKKYKDKKYACSCFHSVRLKMNDPKFINNFFNITKNWESKKNLKLLGKSFASPRKEPSSQQDFFYLSPTWLNLIISECGWIPNEYSLNTALKRINKLKQYKKIPIKKQNLFNILLSDKTLAAGAFVISMDLEFRGTQGGYPSLCMSEKYKDFLEFMLDVAKKWNWTNSKKLSSVNIENSKRLCINASPQFEFRVSMKGLQEIYKLGGPLSNDHKNKCVSFHVKRSKSYIPLGFHHQKKKPKEKILKSLKEKPFQTTTDLQFVTGTRTDVVLDHLHKLEHQGKVKKERRGKKYIWSLI